MFSLHLSHAMHGTWPTVVCLITDGKSNSRLQLAKKKKFLFKLPGARLGDPIPRNGGIEEWRNGGMDEW